MVSNPWRKSSFCGDASCLEIADLPDGGVLLRDTDDPANQCITVPPASWQAFKAGVQAGDFD